MTEEIKNRLEQIQAGKVPDGYIKTRAGIMPVDWNVNKKAKEVFKSHTNKKHSNDMEILAATQENGIVPRSQIDIDIKCSDEGISGYKKVDAGDFIISLRSFQGGIEYSPYNGIMSPAYTVLRSIQKIADEYYKNYFKTESFISRLNGAVYGIRDGKQIGYEDFGDLIIHNPPLPEQQKISEILMQCDKVIKLHQCRIEKIKKLKRACLNKMFPKKGSNVPEIRFPGFTGAWEQRKLGEISDIKTGPFGSTLHADDYVDDGTPIITTEHFKNGEIANQKNGIPQVSEEDIRKLQSYVLRAGDIVFSRVGSVDINALITLFQSGWLFSGRVLRVRTNNSIDSRYLHYELSTERAKNDVVGRAVGQTMPSINTEILKKTTIYLPVEIEEQQQIGTFFLHLDNLITLHQRMLNEKQELKKALMQLLLTGIIRVNQSGKD